MTIYKGNTPLRAYKGDYKPINIYKGETKVAGWENETQQGEQLDFVDTYKDDATGLELLGKSIQLSDHYAKTGLSSQSGTPTPTTPITITSNLPAGTYKTTLPNGEIYEFTLTDDLRGIGTVLDRVVFDRVSKRGYEERNCGKTVLNNTETWYILSGNCNAESNLYYTIVAHGGTDNAIKCSHFVTTSIISSAYKINGAYGNIVGNVVYFRVRLDTGITTLEQWKTFVAANNITLHRVLDTPTRTSLTFTKVSSSTATEIPMTFLTSTPEPNYEADVYSSENFNLSITGGQAINYPITLRGIPNGSGGWTAQDKVDNDNSKVVRNIATYTITGTETPIVSTAGIYTKILIPISAKPNTSETALSALCLKLPPISRTGYDTPTQAGICINSTGEYIAIVLPTSLCGSTVDSVKAYFVANNMAVDYAKATPTEEAITKQTISTTQLLTEFSTDVVIKPDIKVTVKVMTL